MPTSQIYITYCFRWIKMKVSVMRLLICAYRIYFDVDMTLTLNCHIRARGGSSSLPFTANMCVCVCARLMFLSLFSDFAITRQFHRDRIQIAEDLCCATVDRLNGNPLPLTTFGYYQKCAFTKISLSNGTSHNNGIERHGNS